MPAIRDILVIGGGVGGLAAAAAFAQRGVRVTVVERRADAHVLGVGINQPANSLRLLKRLGVLDEILAAGFTYDRMWFHDRDGGLVVETHSALGGDVPANCAVSRAVLAQALTSAAIQAGAAIRYDVRPDHIEQYPDRAEVRFNDGSAGSYDLVAAFDGMRSRTRGLLFGEEFEPRFTGCAVWRVTLPRDPSVECCQLFHGIDTKAGLIPVSHEQMYLFLVSREPGRPSYQPERFHDLLIERLAEHGGLVGRLREALRPDSEIIYSPLYETLLTAPWHRGRIVIAGDAAHVSAPHLTQGAAMALEDALLLAELVSRDVDLERSLVEFAERRLPRVRLVQDVSRGILAAEMAVTPETIQASLDELRDELPARLAKVEAILNQLP